MTIQVEFFSLSELLSPIDRPDADNFGLETLLNQSVYSPSLESVRKFLVEVMHLKPDAVEKKFFYGLCPTNEHELVGFAQYRMTDEVADLDFLIISQYLHGRGFAKMLLEQSLSAIQLAGAKRVMLEVGETNFAAKHLYLRFGFKLISVRKRYYKDGENALIMELVF